MKQNIEKDTVLFRHPNQLFSTIDDEVVMLSVPNGEYYNLNSIGSYIWQILEIPKTFDEIIKNLCEIYEVDEQFCKEDTTVFLEGLVEKGVVQIANG